MNTIQSWGFNPPNVANLHNAATQSNSSDEPHERNEANNLSNEVHLPNGPNKANICCVQPLVLNSKATVRSFKPLNHKSGPQSTNSTSHTLYLYPSV